MNLRFSYSNFNQGLFQAPQSEEISQNLDYSALLNFKAELEKKSIIDYHVKQYRSFLEQNLKNPLQNLLKNYVPQLQTSCQTQQSLSPLVIPQLLVKLPNLSQEVSEKINQSIFPLKKEQENELSTNVSTQSPTSCDSESPEIKRTSDCYEEKPQRGQNKMKNHQGAIAGKIKKLCKKDKKTGENNKLFERATQGLTDEEKEEFQNWVATYQKKDKTWVSLQRFLESSSKFGIIFVDMIDLLLSEEFESEYQKCLDEGKMSDNAKEMLKQKENKEFYRMKFALIMDGIQGKALNYDNEIRKSRKTLKTK